MDQPLVVQIIKEIAGQSIIDGSSFLSDTEMLFWNGSSRFYCSYHQFNFAHGYFLGNMQLFTPEGINE